MGRTFRVEKSGGRLNGQVSEELSGKNRGILGVHLHLGERKKSNGGEMEVPSQNLGTGKLITSRGTSLIWTNGHEREGEGFLRKLLIAFPFVVCLIAHECLFSCNEDEILFQAKEKSYCYNYRGWWKYRF